MSPTLRNTSLPFVELPGNGLGDFASEDGTSAPLLESSAPTEVPAPIEDAVLVMVDAYPDQPHGVVAHEPPPNRHPVRRLVLAIRRAALAVLFAPVLVVAWFLLRIWWVARLSATRSWQGVTSAVAWLWSCVVRAALSIVDAIGLVVDFVLNTVAAIGRGIVGAIAGAIGAVGRLITAIRMAIVHAVLAVRNAIVNAAIVIVTGIRDAIGRAVALVRAAFAAGVRGVFGAVAFVVGTIQRAIQSTASFALGACHAVLRLVLGAVHTTTSSIAAVGRRVWRVITGIRDTAVAAVAAGVALVTRASRIAAAPFVVAARGLGFIAGRSLRTLVVTLSITGFLAWRGLLLVLGGTAIVTGTLFGLVLVVLYGVRLLATTCIALARAVGPASTRAWHACAAGVAAVGNGVARGVVGFGSAARNAVRLGAAAAVGSSQRALTTARQIAHAAAVRFAAALAAAAAVSVRAVHAAWTGTRASAAHSAREALVLARTANRAAAARLLVASGVTGRAIEHTAALSQVAWESASRVRARVYHEAPVVRVNFAAVPGRAGDVRVATTLALASSAALMLMGAGLVLFLMPQTRGRSVPPAVVASRQAVAIPLGPIVAAARQPEAAASRPPTAAAKAPAAVPRAAEPPATIEPKPAGSSLSTARVRAIWDKTDTRSLDRAIAEMRSATLAFRRCEMRMTSPDVATATCNESASPRVAWTFDFRRNDDRWLIEGVSTTGAPSVAR